jgi:hypothetical protein
LWLLDFDALFMDAHRIKGGEFRLIVAPFSIASMIESAGFTNERFLGVRPVKLQAWQSTRIPRVVFSDTRRMSLLLRLLTSHIEILAKSSVKLFVQPVVSAACPPAEDTCRGVVQRQVRLEFTFWYDGPAIDVQRMPLLFSCLDQVLDQFRLTTPPSLPSIQFASAGYQSLIRFELDVAAEPSPTTGGPAGFSAPRLLPAHVAQGDVAVIAAHAEQLRTSCLVAADGVQTPICLQPNRRVSNDSSDAAQGAAGVAAVTCQVESTPPNMLVNVAQVDSLRVLIVDGM